MTREQSDFLKETLLEYLKTNFTPWNLNKFSVDNTLELYDKLQQSIPMETLLTCDQQITKHLKTFFHDLGTLEVKVEAFKQITIKTNIDPLTMKTYQLLKHYQAHFQHSKDANLLVINEKVTQVIFEKLQSEQDAFRHHIRMSLPILETLGDNFAILFGKSRITVRKNINSSSAEKRFSGLPADDLDALMKKYFKDIDEELPLLMEKRLHERFLFQTLSNQEFEATHIKILQEEILKLVKIRSRQDLEIMLALTNYILRLKFDLLHSMIAELLIDRVVDKNAKAEQFLSFYTQGVVSFNGQKYQIPQLEDSQKKLWSMPNIINTAIQYNNFHLAYDKKANYIDDMDNTLEHIDDDIIQAGATIKKIKAGALTHHEGLSATAAQIQKIRHTFQSQGHTLDAAHKEKLQHTVKDLEAKEREQMVIRDQFDKGLSQAQKDYSDLKYKKVTTLERYNSEIDHLETIEQKHKDIITKYELMISAVVKALTGKKIKV